MRRVRVISESATRFVFSAIWLRAFGTETENLIKPLTTLIATVMFVGIGFLQASADEPLKQRELAARIIELGKRDIGISRLEVDISECDLIGYRRDLVREGEKPDPLIPLSLNNADVLMSVVRIDLQTAEINPPPSYKGLLTPLSDDRPAIFRMKPGSSILYPGMGDDAKASLPFTAGPSQPILIEEPVHRKRTKDYIKRKKTRPSARGDGESFVFRDAGRILFKAEGRDQVERLVEMEKALIEYQERFCRNLS